MALWLVVMLQLSGFDLAASGKPVPTPVPPCEGRGAGDEVVVCGGRRDRYRLPLRNEREAPETRARGEAPGGMAALTPAAPCGIFAGERRCGKREAAEYGYGNGRDPVTLVGRLVQEVVDPDGD